MKLQNECERTCSIIKPDATRRNLVGAICGKKLEDLVCGLLLRNEFGFLENKLKDFMRFTGRPFFDELCDFMISEPVVVQVLEGEGL